MWKLISGSRCLIGPGGAGSEADTHRRGNFYSDDHCRSLSDLGLLHCHRIDDWSEVEVLLSICAFTNNQIGGAAAV